MLSPWPLHRGTSPVDWCEGNYLVSPVIAEFVNTMSNVLFIVFPPLLTGLFREYALYVNRGVYLIWALLLTIGLTSAYFHATLSLVGQLLDEVAILWLLLAAFAMWLPKRYFMFGIKDRKTFQLYMAIVCCAATLLTCIHPVLNAFALMGLGVPATALLVIEIRRCNNPRVVKLGYRCALLWLAALVCWINDRLFCEVWSKLNFPYLHGAWHILIAITSYSACVLFAYFDAWDTVPEQLPAMKFWPSDRFELGVPYIILRRVHKDHQKI
ncbi:alkaline ceramidase [Parasteatoda tepidariorum]|nr:alkaline ceramidase [Parasteatoda tepidariorum]XP_042900587.1 alkaline ceramidase [Parasteatoda tepidariorum]